MNESPEVLSRIDTASPDNLRVESALSSQPQVDTAEAEPEIADVGNQSEEDLRERDRLLIQIQIQDFGLANTHEFSEELLQLQQAGTPLEPVFKHMSQLDHIAPGVIDWLHTEMNIVNFGRYPAELLMSMYESDPAMPWGLIVYPSQDVNYLPGVDMWPLKLMHDSIGDQVQPIIVEAGSTDEIAELLFKFAKGRGPASFCLITALSKSDGLNMSSSSLGQVSTESLDEDPGFCDALKSGLTDDAEILLCSSSTGRPGGLAEQISRRTNRTVLAPTGTIGEAFYGATVIDGKVSFSPEFNGPGGEVQVSTIHPDDLSTNPDEIQAAPTLPPKVDRDSSEGDSVTA